MISLYSLIWVIAAFTGILGFLRGWARELMVTAGAFLSIYLVFQFDSLLRGTLLVGFGRDQVFVLQLILFGGIIYAAYRQRLGTGRDRERDSLGSGILGAVVGLFNGYLIGGMLWYFLDINEYPFAGLITAPAPGAISAESIAILPMLVFSGGVTGGGEALILIVVAVFGLVLVAV